MVEQAGNPTYDNCSQRAVSSFIKLLTSLNLSAYVSENWEFDKAYRDLRVFFQDFYRSLNNQPEIFGLPVKPDIYISLHEPDEKEKKQQVKRQLDKSWKLILAGLDFLRLTGLRGRLQDDGLVLEYYPEILKETKVGKKFIQGFSDTGLSVESNGKTARIVHERLPGMMAALKILAQHSASYDDEKISRFIFATCDFRALQGYLPQAEDLYRAFTGAEYRMVSDLHDYFMEKGFRTDVGIHAPFAWEVKYQGERKIKATPLFQIQYDERYFQPLRIAIKPASTARLADLLPRQSQLLQDDFANRANVCRGEECGWCRNNKTLGPTDVEYYGEIRTLCWYTNPDIREYDENTVELVKEYERMHAELLPA